MDESVFVCNCTYVSRGWLLPVPEEDPDCVVSGNRSSVMVDMDLISTCRSPIRPNDVFGVGVVPSVFMARIIVIPSSCKATAVCGCSLIVTTRASYRRRVRRERFEWPPEDCIPGSPWTGGSLRFGNRLRVTTRASYRRRVRRERFEWPPEDCIPGSPWTGGSLRFGNRLRRTFGCGSTRRLSA